jgi:hypothetical protein
VKVSQNLVQNEEPSQKEHKDRQIAILGFQCVTKT